jgi:uncharacterized RDD family membrane protein YckC
VTQTGSASVGSGKTGVTKKTAVKPVPDPVVETPAAEPEAPITRPASVTAVAVLTATVAAAMIGYAVFLIVGGFVGQPVLHGRAEAAGGIFLLFGLGIAWVCRGLARLEPWSRTPAMLTQLLLVGSAYWLLQGAFYVQGVLAGLVGVGGVVLLFVPASHRVLSRDMH